MTLNPIVALSYQLQKLINEHGSASTLREHLTLFRDHVINLEKKLAISESENAVLEIENSRLKSEAQNLKEKNAELSNKIQNYENFAHSDLLDDSKIKILVHLAKQNSSIPEGSISASIGLSHHLTLFHIVELLSKDMAQRSHNPFGGPNYLSLSHNGRRYLSEHKLL